MRLTGRISRTGNYRSAPQDRRRASSSARLRRSLDPVQVTPHRQRGGRRLVRLTALLGAAMLALVLLRAAPALAHSQLEGTTPEAGAQLDEAPREVVLRFAEGVRPVPGGLRVLAEDGTRVDEARPRNSGGTVTLALPALADGAYVVSWRVVSADGHPVRGAFTFRVGGVGDQTATGRLAERLLVSGTSKPEVSATAAVLRALTFAAMALLIGASSHAVFGRVGGTVGGRARSTIRGATVVAGVSGLGLLLTYGPLVTGQSLGSVGDGTLIDDSLADHVGQAIAARTVLLVLLGMVLLGMARLEMARRDDSAPPTGGRRWSVSGVAALVLGIGVAQAFSGHGGTGRFVAVALPSTVVHVIAMGVWAGGLVFLFLMLRGTDPASPEALAQTRHFSRQAGVAVAAVAATGSFALWRQAGSLQALRTTPSGTLLLIKLGIVALLVLLGAKNRRTLAGADLSPGAAVRAVRRTVGVEVVGMAAVIGVTALVVNLAPARDVVSRPIAVTVQTATGLVDITVDPAERGANELHLYALTNEGASRPVEAISATLSNAGAGVERLESRIVRAGPNHFQALSIDLPLAGTWRVDVSVKLDAFTEESGSTTFTLR